MTLTAIQELHPRTPVEGDHPVIIDRYVAPWRDGRIATDDAVGTVYVGLCITCGEFAYAEGYEAPWVHGYVTVREGVLTPFWLNAQIDPMHDAEVTPDDAEGDEVRYCATCGCGRRGTFSELFEAEARSFDSPGNSGGIDWTCDHCGAESACDIADGY